MYVGMLNLDETGIFYIKTYINNWLIWSTFTCLKNNNETLGIHRMKIRQFINDKAHLLYA